MRAAAVPLHPYNAAATRLGRLDYHGGLQLSSKDRRFGGLSGLLVAADGSALVAVSDRGYRFEAQLLYDAVGQLVGIRDATIADLRGPKGGSLAELPAGDAEDLAGAGDRQGIVVAFETRPRLWIYPAAGTLPVPVTPPEGLNEAPGNEGIEALTRLADGRLLALTEGLRTEGGVVGWVGEGRLGWSALAWRTDGGFQPTGATTSPAGDVLVLERRILPPGARVRLLQTADIAPGALLDGEEIARMEGALTFDNMEGIDARRGSGGETFVYLLSDDNNSFLQRTLLLMFRLVE